MPTASARSTMSRGPSSADALVARLAATSRLVADQLAIAWPAARSTLGADADRWLALAGALAACTTATGPLAYLRIEPARVRRIGVGALGRWVDAAREIGDGSPSLATAFVEATAPLLGDVAIDTVVTAARVAAALRADGGWRGERVALAFLGALATAVRVFDAEELSRWGRLGPALRAAADDGVYFRTLPAVVGEWTADERARWLAAVDALARRHVPAAVALYRDFPGTLRELPAAPRAALVDVLAHAATGALPSDVAGVLPIAATLVLAVPAHGRAVALDLARRVAEEFPPGVVPLLRAL